MMRKRFLYLALSVVFQLTACSSSDQRQSPGPDAEDAQSDGDGTDRDGDSGEVSEIDDSGAPTAPSNITATQVNDGFRIDWVNESGDEARFIIYRYAESATLPVAKQLSEDDFEEIARVDSTETSYIDRSATHGYRYRYGVASTSDGGTSDIALTAGMVWLRGANLAPTAEPQSLTGEEDNAIEVTLAGADGDGDRLTYTIVDPPMSGTLTGEAPSLIYISHPNFHGEDSFTFVVSDGRLDSQAATVSITVAPINDAPSGNALARSTPEDVAVQLALTGTDIDGDAITFAIHDSPIFGSLETFDPAAGTVTYVPDQNATGDDTFTFTVTDGTLVSEPATVTIKVGVINDAPVASNVQIGTNEDSEVAIALSATDIDGDTLSYALLSTPTHGTLTGTAPRFVYVPAANFSGSDSFTFQASDGIDDSNVATVTIEIASVNDAPVASPRSVSTDEDISISLVLSATDIDGDSVSFEIIDQPRLGSIELFESSTGALRYVPNANVFGSDSFTFVASDGSGSSAVTTVEINILPINDVPVATDQFRSTPEDTPVSFLLEGTDVDDDSLTYAMSQRPVEGDFPVFDEETGEITYAPGQNANGTVVFEFTVSDGELVSEPATLTLEIVPVNDIPIAEPLALTTSEDVPVAVELRASDPDGDELSFNIVASPTLGRLEGSGASLTYIPHENANGVDTFRYTAADDDSASAAVNATITIDDVNDRPTANEQRQATSEDTPLSLTLSGDDVDEDALIFSIDTPPTQGVLTDLDAATGTVSFEPAQDFNGTATFTFRVSDGALVSEPAAVTINVGAANDAPLADAQALEVDEDSVLAFALTGTDLDGDSLTFAVLSSPLHGSLEGAPPDLIYTPDANFFGSDSIRFTANDNSESSEPATIEFTVNPVNDAPQSNSQGQTTLEDTPLPIVLTGRDIDRDSLSFEIAGAPSVGTIEDFDANDGSLTYVPGLDATGVDTFTFTVFDGTARSDAATVTINVGVVNDAPIAESQSLATDEDTSLAIELTASDADGDTLSYAVIDGPEHGELQGSGDQLVYVPDENFHGEDSFTFIASDDSADSAVTTVSISVDPVNDSPVAEAGDVSVNEDSSVVITLSATDVDGDDVNFTIDQAPTHGELSGTGSTRTYRPDANYHGEDSFTFAATDGEATSTPAGVTITVIPLNDLPVAQPQNVAIDEDVSVSITLGGSDVDGDALTFTITDQPTNGTLAGSAPTIEYAPAANWNGTDAFRFLVDDGVSSSVQVAVTITVHPVNDAPVAQAQSVTVQEDGTLAIELTGDDIDGDTLNFQITRGTESGQLSGDAPNLAYTPNPNFTGTDSLLFTVSDGQLISEPATISITVQAVNDAPVATGFSVETDEDTPVDVALLGEDADGDALSYTITSDPTLGTLSGAAPALVYTPAANAHGTDTFRYRVEDSSDSSAEATVTIVVNPINDAPIANNDSATTTEEDAVTVDVLSNDSDVESGSFLIITKINGQTFTSVPVIMTLPSGAAVTVGSQIEYSPNGAYNALNEGETATETFTYTAVDGGGAEASATVTVTIQGSVDLASLSAPGNVALNVRFPVTWSFEGSLPANATCTIDMNGNGSVEYSSADGDFDCASGSAQVAFPEATNGHGAKTIRFGFETAQTSGTSATQTAITPVMNLVDRFQTLPDPNTIYAGWESSYKFGFVPLIDGEYTCFLDSVDDGVVTFPELSAVDCVTGQFEALYASSVLGVRKLRAYVVYGDIDEFSDGQSETNGFQLIPLSDEFTINPKQPAWISDSSWKDPSRDNYYQFYGPAYGDKPHTCQLDIFRSDGSTYSTFTDTGPGNAGCNEANKYDFNPLLPDNYRYRMTVRSGTYTLVRENSVNKESIFEFFDNLQESWYHNYVVSHTATLSGYDGLYIDKAEVGVAFSHTQTDWMSFNLIKSGESIQLYGNPKCDLDDGETAQYMIFRDDAPIHGGSPSYCAWTKVNVRSDFVWRDYATVRRPNGLLGNLENKPVNGDYKIEVYNPYNEGDVYVWAFHVEIWPKAEPPAYLNFRPRGHIDMNQDRRYWEWTIEVDDFDGFTIRDMNVNAIMNWTSAYKYATYRYDSRSGESRPHRGAAPADLEYGLLDMAIEHTTQAGDTATMTLYKNDGICNDIFDNGIGEPYTWTNWAGVENTDADRKDGSWWSIGFRDHADAEHPNTELNNPDYYCPFEPGISGVTGGNPAAYYGGAHETIRVENIDDGASLGNQQYKTFDVFNDRPVNGTWKLILSANVVEADPASWVFPWPTRIGEQAEGDIWGWDLNMTVTPPGCSWVYDYYERDFVLSCP